MTTPTFVTAGARSGVTAATSNTPGLPASRVNGNLLIGIIDIHATATKQFTWPSPWVVLTSQVGQAATSQHSYSVAYRYVDGTETAPAITWSGAADCQAQIFQYKDTHGSLPIGAWIKWANWAGGTTTSYVAPGLQTSKAGSCAILMVVTSANLTAPTPTGYTSRNNASGSGGSIGLFDVDMTTLGSTNDINTTFSATCGWSAVIIELSSAAGDNRPRLCLDGYPQGTTITTGSSITRTLYTSTANAVVIGIAYSEDPTAFRTHSISGGSGLTWAMKDQKQVNGSTSKADLEIWWALASATQSAQTITDTLSGGPDAASMLIFPVIGTTAGDPFNAGPFYNSNDGNSGNSTIQVTGCTSNGQPSLEFFNFSTWDVTTPTLPTGFLTVGTLTATNTRSLNQINGVKYNGSAVSNQTRATQGTTSAAKWQIDDFFLGTPINRAQAVFMGG